eukprot:10558272-Prorocentrum_lima.AAC.1
MTSSLVGSEMCIRDRKLGIVSSTFQQCRKRNSAFTTLPMKTSGCPVAVSYTHLTLPTICSV